MSFAPRRLGFAAAAMIAASAAPAAAFTVVPYFDSTITGAGNATDIEASINAAVAVYSTMFTDPGTVNIVFKLGSTGLAASSNLMYTLSYANFTNLLAIDSATNPTNTVLPVALAHLSSGNGADGSVNVWATSAQLRVGLGVSSAHPCFDASGATALNSNSTACIGTYDGVVTLSNSAPIDFLRPISGSTYDAFALVQHEVDEVLGAGGPATTLGTFAPTCSALNPSRYGVLDLYRYSAPGTPSYSNCGSDSSYLSFDGGTTSIVAFNQTAGADYADLGPSGYVQSAFGSPGLQLGISTSSPEFLMLQSTGYDPVPEPATMALFGFGLVGLAAARRRRAG